MSVPKGKSFGEGPMTVLQCPGEIWMNGATGRHMFVTSGLVDAETMHNKAFRLTANDPDESVTVHNHPYAEAKCNPECVKYPGKVPVLDYNQGTEATGASEERAG